jgi:hypothetical protein
MRLATMHLYAFAGTDISAACSHELYSVASKPLHETTNRDRGGIGWICTMSDFSNAQLTGISTA